MKKRSSSHYGYGIHNVSKQKVTKKDIKAIRNKKWKDITSFDIYLLYQNKWTTEKIQKEFNASLIQVMNRLRLHEK